MVDTNTVKSDSKESGERRANMHDAVTALRSGFPFSLAVTCSKAQNWCVLCEVCIVHHC